MEQSPYGPAALGARRPSGFIAPAPSDETVVTVRQAIEADVAELIRLRAVMFKSMGVDPAPETWRDAFGCQLRDWLRLGSAMAGFVVDDPARSGRLAACGLGMITDRIPGVFDPTWKVGYLASMVTIPEYRRRGFGQAIVAALVDWFTNRGVRTIELHTMPRAAPMYRAAGFTDPYCPALSRYGVDNQRGAGHDESRRNEASGGL
jgi:GNAT superfamily N-acetyltransferase